MCQLYIMIEVYMDDPTSLIVSISISSIARGLKDPLLCRMFDELPEITHELSCELPYYICKMSEVFPKLSSPTILFWDLSGAVQFDDFVQFLKNRRGAYKQ